MLLFLSPSWARNISRFCSSSIYKRAFTTSIQYNLVTEDLTLVGPSDLRFLHDTYDVKDIVDQSEMQVNSDLEMPIPLLEHVQLSTYTPCEPPASNQTEYIPGQANFNQGPYHVFTGRLPFIVADVRPQRDFATSHVPGAISVPWMTSAEWTISKEVGSNNERNEEVDTDETLPQWVSPSQKPSSQTIPVRRQSIARLLNRSRTNKTQWEYVNSTKLYNNRISFGSGFKWQKLVDSAKEGSYNSKYGNIDVDMMHRIADNLLVGILNHTTDVATLEIKNRIGDFEKLSNKPIIFVPLLPRLLIFHCTLSLIRGPKMASMAQCLVSSMKQKIQCKKENSGSNEESTEVSSESSRASKIDQLDIEVALIEGGFKGWERSG